MKKKYKFLSEIEWQILRVLWHKKQASVREVWQQAYPNGERAYTTIQTYMERMAKKQVLQKEKIGMVNIFRPLVTEKQALNIATEGLVSRAFNGSFGTLAAFLIDSRSLSRADLEKIKKLIDQKEEELK